MVAPRAGAVPAGQDRVERDRHTARQTDSTAVRVAAEQHAKAGVRGLPEDLGRVRDSRIEKPPCGMSAAAFSMLSTR